METWDPAWNDALTDYLAPFRKRIGDQRTWTTLSETVRGILASGALRCKQIAATSPILAAV
ncbi:MAG: hypothetical protein KatS3mg057_0810 [Herpetosiphonaceae bacterium]|nr:MAG: hypothetical protein KatS3mg057_0810 [Herpetosiphonaceae bacterium]